MRRGALREVSDAGADDRVSGPDPRRPEPVALDAADRAIVDQVEGALARGFELERWWLERSRDGGFRSRFEVTSALHRDDTSYGFFDRLTLDGRQVPVLGNFQEQAYDRPKSRPGGGTVAAEEIDRQLREFVLRYFLRIADYRDPQPTAPDRPRLAKALEPFSLFAGTEPTRRGFGYSQHYFKRAGSGEVGRFPAGGRHAIVDLREVGPVYDWIVLRVRIYDFAFAYGPFGAAAPSVRLPLEESSYVVVHSRFVHDETRPRPGELGRYGLGYSFLRNPEAALVAWGPGKFDGAFQSIDFRSYEDGRIRAEMAFVANRPTAVCAIPWNPLLAGALALDLATGGASRGLTEPVHRLARRLPGSGRCFDPVLPALALLGWATRGLSGRRLGLEPDQLDRRLIHTHFVQHHTMIQGSLPTWRLVPDWLDEEALPHWVRSGESA